MAKREKKELIPNENEVLKNRIFGMPINAPKSRHQKVAFSIMIKIAYDQLKEDPSRTTFEFNTVEFINMLGISSAMRRNFLLANVFYDEDGFEHKKNNYSLEETFKVLSSKKIAFRFKDNNGVTYRVKYENILPSFDLTKNKIIFKFGDWIRENIVTSNNAYLLNIPVLGSIRSSYSVTLYEQIEQRWKWGKWHVSIAMLKNLLGLKKDSYPRMNDFKKRVLEVAKKEISEKTRYKLDYELIKSPYDKRSYEKVRFFWDIRGVDQKMNNVEQVSGKDVEEVEYIDLSQNYDSETEEIVIDIQTDQEKEIDPNVFGGW